MAKVRLAFIGVGDIAERDYLPEWHRLAGQAEIVTVCGRNPERVRRIAEKYQVPKWSTDYRELVTGDIDAVVSSQCARLTPVRAIGRRCSLRRSPRSPGCRDAEPRRVLS